MDQELKDIDQYNTVDRTCPMCQNYPLEYQTSSGIKEIFCSHCDYYETVEE